MTSAALSAKNSTTVRLLAAQRALRTSVAWASPIWASLAKAYFSAASRIAPGLAKAHAEQLFTIPPRHAGTRMRAPDARRETVSVGRHDLAVWHDGAPDAPAVLLAHGWGGRGAQMASLAGPLLDAGYRVVWFDQPAHGGSGSGRVALPDFERALHALARTHGPFHAAIGHSLGAAALGLALRRGLRLERVVFLGTPASIRDHVHGFGRRLGLTPRVLDAMRAVVERRYGVAFDDIDRIEELARVTTPALFIHDAQDRQVPFADAQRLSRLMPRAHLLRTHGLGHNRILHDHAVLRACADFIAAPERVPPQDLPLLPLPAPLF